MNIYFLFYDKSMSAKIMYLRISNQDKNIDFADFAQSLPTCVKKSNEMYGGYFEFIGP